MKYKFKVGDKVRVIASGSGCHPKKIASKSLPEYVFVTSQLRKSVLTDESQGSFIYKGIRTWFEFKNLGGGVYRASIKR